MEDNVPDGILSQESKILVSQSRRTLPQQHSECRVRVDGAYIYDCPHGCMGKNLDFTKSVNLSTALKACYHAYIPTEAFDSHKAFCPAGYGERNWQKRIDR
ncbi:Delta-like protein [Trichinella pseudospiralis]